ncbi:Hypothetical Protein OBI_RACECAR_197 [Arthrobacter phage Racecar]|nr:hypothetical protein PBI_RACECAR_279 [Arthrobacter phage Racecar]
MIRLSLESSVDAFEKSISTIMADLEYHAETLGRHRAQHCDSRSRGRISGEEFLQGFYIHVKSLKKIVELMRDAEQFVADMADEPEDGDYARGQLQSLKQVFLSISKEAKLASEEWSIVELEATRHGGNPITPRAIFNSLKRGQTLEPVSFPADFYKPYFKAI